MSRIYVGVTDVDWFRFLRARPKSEDEVNFWQPSGDVVKALPRGSMWVFKLKAPISKIGGFGIFHSAFALPLSFAWDAYGTANGRATLDDFARSITGYRAARAPAADRVQGARIEVGCQMLTSARFFEDHEMFDVPGGWGKSIVKGKYYDEGDVGYAEMFGRCLAIANATSLVTPSSIAADGPRFGSPQLIVPRIGQTTFRAALVGAYQRQCAVTQEHSLPVLEAAHIRPYAQGGTHEVANGILLRSDIHRLFDAGYVTVDETLRFRVSSHLRREFNNGKVYYALDGKEIEVPKASQDRPDPDFLAHHRTQIFKAG